MTASNGRVVVTTETITPEMAARMLGHVDNWRSVNDHHMRNLSRAMEAGRWEMNGNPIKFSSSGALIDGEHRLQACVRSKTPFRTLVARGIEACATIDTGGRNRTAGQILQKQGKRNATQLATAARLLKIHETLGLARLNNPQACFVSVQEI